MGRTRSGAAQRTDYIYITKYPTSFVGGYKIKILTLRNINLEYHLIFSVRVYTMDVISFNSVYGGIYFFHYKYQKNARNQMNRQNLAKARR